VWRNVYEGWLECRFVSRVIAEGVYISC